MTNTNDHHQGFDESERPSILIQLIRYSPGSDQSTLFFKITRFLSKMGYNKQLGQGTYAMCHK